MVRAQLFFKVAMSLVLVAVLVGATHAQQVRRGARFGMRDSLLFLLRAEQVQAELKLTDEQKEKIQATSEKLMEEMREQFTALRDNSDQGNFRAKMAELSDQFDRKARGELRDVLEREQMMRLYQIRLQNRPVVDSLSNEFLANRLEITEEQQKALATIKKDTESKRSDLMSTFRDADQDQRQELMQEFRTLSSDADAKAIEVLTDDQKKSFEEMKGKKIELQMQGRRGR